MKSSPRRGAGGFDVFDFKEEDELADLASEKFLEKFKSSSVDHHSTLKEEFLECVTEGANHGTKEVGSIHCVDVDAIDCKHGCDDANSFKPLGIEGESFADKKEFSGLDATQDSDSISHEQPDLKPDSNGSRCFISELERKDSILEAPTPEKGQIDSALLEAPSKNEPVDVISDADESMSGNSPSSPTSETAEDGVSLNGYATEQSFGDMGMDDTDMEVVLCTDYVLYRDIYCTGPQLTFSPSCIKISGSNPNGNEGTFNFECGVDDVIDIACQWTRRVETVIIKLRVITEDAVQTNNECSTPGIEELKIAVVEPNWSHKQEVITSMNVKYEAVWDIVDNMDMGMEEDHLLGRRRYFPNFDEPFEEVIYPKGDPDAVSISKRDVDLLQPDTYVNDTIIDFYIKYLKNQIQPEERNRFHFFNSFFFRKLADMDKDPNSASDGRAAFLRVRKWTRKVDIFEKDFIFIPINFSLHWSLIVICHPGEVARLKDEGLDKSPKVPCILHMDSIKGNHTGIKTLIQSYLWEEWKERQTEAPEDLSSKFLNLRFVSLELPQQENSFDCGLFLLHYLELFLAEAPVNFSPFDIIKSSKFLDVNWFPPAEASLKRTLIQKLISVLLKNHSPEISSAACSDEDGPFEFPENNKSETGVEFLSQRCSPAIAPQGNLSSSQAGQGIEMTVLSVSSISSQCVNDTGLVLKEFLESGATAGSLLGRLPSFDHPSSYYHLNGPTEEDAENSDHFVFLPSGDTGFQQMVGIIPQESSIPYSSRDLGMETSYNLGISMHTEHDNVVDSSPETLSCASDDSDVGIIENCPVRENVGTNQREETDDQRHLSTANMECLTDSVLLDAFAVEGSEDPDKMYDGNENNDGLPSHQENSDILLHQDSDIMGNGEVACDSVQEIGDDDQIAETHEQQPAKELTMGNGEVACDSVQEIGEDQIAETHEQQTAKELIMGNGEVACDTVQEIGDDQIAETNEQQPAKELLMGNGEVACDSVQEIVDDQIAETHEQQPAKELIMGNREVACDTVQEIIDDQIAETNEQQPACDNVQEIVDDQIAETNEQQPAKELIMGNGEVACDNVQEIIDDQIAETHEQQPAKELIMGNGEVACDNVQEIGDDEQPPAKKTASYITPRRGRKSYNYIKYIKGLPSVSRTEDDFFVYLLSTLGMICQPVNRFVALYIVPLVDG
ncbi:probable ubiquitin-like-specific protease 2B isoform X5 [Quercus robur]|uniref:probable ubiquitin-like-specific protease 2B isoform X5 n=1 Tax=Quercus robur TaxID=38942 RepID=UPI002162B954|nr:probable ubiquitin-like-specific protease 2B isoform X5 [Quercus robur]